MKPAANKVSEKQKSDFGRKDGKPKQCIKPKI
jgi:hypothetical protein